MLSEPRSRLLLMTPWCQLRIESGSLNLLTMLTAGVPVLFPGVPSPQRTINDSSFLPSESGIEFVSLDTVTR